MEPANPLYTSFTCDRCKKDNAVRLSMHIGKNEHDDQVFKEIDICAACMVDFCGHLLAKIPYKEREAFIHAFTEGTIR